MSFMRRACTFDNFIVGSSNRNAYAACMEAFENPAGVCNPLMIYGETGTGKTHLLKAVFSRAAAANMRTIFVSGRKARMEGLFQSIRTSFDPADTVFRFILVDDLEEILQSDDNVSELLYLIDSCGRMIPQIVVSSSNPPGRLHGRRIDALLRRLCEGFTVKLGSLDVETRRSIFANEITRMELSLRSGVISFLSDLPLMNYSQVRGMVLKLSAEAGRELELSEKTVLALIIRLIENGELSLPEGYLFPEFLTAASGLETFEAPGTTSPPTTAERKKKPAASCGTGYDEDLDELEKKFDTLTYEISKEISEKGSAGPQKRETGNADRSGSQEVGGGSALIEEWEDDSDRLIEEE